MKNHTTSLFLLLVIAIGFASGGCSLFNRHKQPKSSFKIIEQGDDNPYIIDTPQKIKDTPTQSIEVESGPVNR